MKNGFRIDRFGTKRWFLNGKLHREDGPALIYGDGMSCWYIEDTLHRVDGPAVITSEGTQSWYRNGVLHRVDGPARYHRNGRIEWWLRGRFYEDIYDFAKAANWTDKQIAGWLLRN